MRRRTRMIWVTGAGALAVLSMAVAHPHADFEVLTHRADDPSPARVHAAVDLGVLAVSVLVTWSRQFAR